MDLMPFDEINRLEQQLPIYFENGKIRSRADYEDIIDDMFYLFLLSYHQGSEAVNPDYKPTLKEAIETIDDKVDGLTWRERMKKHFDDNGTIADVVRIIETEAHRDANTAAYETAKKSGKTMKTWHTMMDDRVREQHQWLEGVTIPIDAEFYADGGGHAMYPGAFGIPELDINCRCWLTYK